MKKQWMLPGLAAAGGVAAFALRLCQNATGFEDGTGLAVPGNVPGTILPVLLVLTACAAIVLARKLPKTAESGSFPPAFPMKDAPELLLPVMGVFLMFLSGAADAATALSILPGAVFAPGAHLLLGALSIVSAAGLLLAASACRHQKKDFHGALLLPVTVMLVVRLVLTYRVSSTSPTLAAYYVELLALVFLTLAFFHLSGFAFDDAKPRRFAVSAVLAAVLSMASMADRTGVPLSSLALCAGGALVLLGFLVVYAGKDE